MADLLKNMSLDEVITIRAEQYSRRILEDVLKRQRWSAVDRDAIASALKLFHAEARKEEADYQERLERKRKRECEAIAARRLEAAE